MSSAPPLVKQTLELLGSHWLLKRIIDSLRLEVHPERIGQKFSLHDDFWRHNLERICLGILTAYEVQKLLHYLMAI
jgi:hypothetical protein